MNFGFSTFFYPHYSLDKAIEKIIDAGVRTIEITYDLPHIAETDNQIVKKIEEWKKEGIEFSLHGPIFEVNIGSLFPEIRKQSMQRYKKAILFASKNNIDPIVVHPGYTMLNGKSESLAQKTKEFFFDDLRELCRMASNFEITLALENVFLPFFFFYDIPEFNEIVKNVPEIGMTFDLGHAFITKMQKNIQDPEGTIINDLAQIDVTKLTHAHIHNNFGNRDDHFFDKGIIDLERIIQGLHDLGYAKKIIIESHDIERYSIENVRAKFKDIIM